MVDDNEEEEEEEEEEEAEEAAAPPLLATTDKGAARTVASCCSKKEWRSCKGEGDFPFSSSFFAPTTNGRSLCTSRVAAATASCDTEAGASAAMTDKVKRRFRALKCSATRASSKTVPADAAWRSLL